MNHTVQLSCKQVQTHIPFFESRILDAMPTDPPRAKPGKRGAPQKVTWAHLWFRLIIGMLCGMSSYQDLQRDLAQRPLGPFPRLHLTDDALIKRLKQAGTAPLLEVFSRLSEKMGRLLTTLCPCQLAAWSNGIFAIDESTWDAVQRHLKELRETPQGHVALMPGKLAARFNLRTQQWDLLQFRDNPQGNCKLDCCSLLQGLATGTLLLFDLGYFSFAWLDYLQEMGDWYISRIREDVHYQIALTLYRHEGTLDALVWLGGLGRNGSRSGYLVRLVRFWDGEQIRTYLTNQLDPSLLPLPDIARLYARRWDIELAFKTIKQFLGLHHWWSAIPVLRQQQAILVLIASQLLHAVRLLIAAEQGCDPFEVSLPLLTKALPIIVHDHQHPVVWACSYGLDLGLFRPSSRYVTLAPTPPVHLYASPPGDLPRTRLACYREYAPRPHRAPRNRKTTLPPTTPPTSAGPMRQLSLFSQKVLRGLLQVDK